MTDPLLAIEDWSVRYGGVAVVDGVSLTLGPGETLGIVGESGSGKTQLLLSIIGLLGENAETEGRIALTTRDLAALKPAKRRTLRAVTLSMVFQDPASALNPYLSIGRQLTEGPMAMRGLSRREADALALQALERVRVSEPKRRLKQYPHELSGGMRQRVVIAMALLAEPLLLLADEPTTALDVTLQAEVLDILRGMAAERGMALILVTHDLGVVAHLCRRVAIMYAGRIVESGPVEAIFASPAHPYTKALLAAMPRLDDAIGHELPAIEGQPPAPQARRTGCAFAPRCPSRLARCDAETPALAGFAPGREAACFLVTS